jgi:hypothetical protein
VRPLGVAGQVRHSPSDTDVTDTDRPDDDGTVYHSASYDSTIGEPEVRETTAGGRLAMETDLCGVRW